MDQSVLTCQRCQKQQSRLPTYAEVIGAGPSNPPPSATMYDFLTSSATVQAPLRDVSDYTRMLFPSTLYSYPPAYSPNPPVRPTNDDPQNGTNSPAPIVAYESPTKFTLKKRDKCYLWMKAGQFIFFLVCILSVVAAFVIYIVFFQYA